MKGLKFKFLIIGFLSLSFPSYSQILFEDAVSLKLITEEEKEKIKKDGFVIRPKNIYNRKFKSIRKEHKDDNKIREYIECQLKVIHNGINYQVFVIGNVTRFYADGLIEQEELYDSTGYPIKNEYYTNLKHGHFLLQNNFTRCHTIRNDTLYTKVEYISYRENGDIKSQGCSIVIYTKDPSNGVWTIRKRIHSGNQISYYLDGEIQKSINYNDISPCTDSQ